MTLALLLNSARCIHKHTNYNARKELLPSIPAFESLDLNFDMSSILTSLCTSVDISWLLLSDEDVADVTTGLFTILCSDNWSSSKGTGFVCEMLLGAGSLFSYKGTNKIIFHPINFHTLQSSSRKCKIVLRVKLGWDFRSISVGWGVGTGMPGCMFGDLGHRNLRSDTWGRNIKDVGKLRCRDLGKILKHCTIISVFFSIFHFSISIRVTPYKRKTHAESNTFNLFHWWNFCFLSCLNLSF